MANMDIQIHDNIVVEFGLGKLVIWQTRLEPLADSGDNRGYHGITIERYSIENTVGNEINKEEPMLKIGKDIVLIFHTIKSIDSFIEDLNILKEKLKDSYDIPS